MQFDGREIRDPNERGQIVRQNVIYVALVALAPDGYGLHPIWAVLGCVLLEEVLFVHALGIPLQGKRTSRKMGQQNRRDPRIIVDDLSLGEPGRGIQDFIQVGQTQVLAFDLDDFWFAHADSFRSGRAARSLMPTCNRWM